MQDKLSWQAWEYKQTKKTADWYWAVILIALCLAVAAVFMGNALFAVVIVISTCLLMIFSVKTPRLFKVTLDQRGLTVDDDRYPFATLESFWVDISDKQNQKILFRSKKIFMPLIVIPFDEHDHLMMRDYLLQYLPEHEMHEPVSHKIMERLGF